MSVEPSGKKLTKREQKALKFRASKGSKGKGKKKDSDLTDLPENDLLDENAEVGDVQDVKEKKQRKRKRTEDDDGSAEGGKDEEAGEKGEGEQKPKKKRRKSKAAGNGEGVDQKHRLILFVGNLPYAVTTEQLRKHFESCGEEPQIRLLTPKTSHPPSRTTTPPKSKGCAFLEFTLASSLQNALRLHHSSLGNRKINVELTAGGGGKGDKRKEKIEKVRKRLGVQREKREEKVKKVKEEKAADKEKKTGGGGGGEKKEGKPKVLKQPWLSGGNAIRLG